MKDHRTLQLFACELSFLRARGYGHPLCGGWRSTLMFRDSPVCLNFDSSAFHQPCGRCGFFDFVDQKDRDTLIPGHHIPLNNNGGTVHSLYRNGTQESLDGAMRNWLQATIEQLREQEKSS